MLGLKFSNLYLKLLEIKNANSIVLENWIQLKLDKLKIEKNQRWSRILLLLLSIFWEIQSLTSYTLFSFFIIWLDI